MDEPQRTLPLPPSERELAEPVASPPTDREAAAGRSPGDLAGLVEMHGNRHPDRIEEWEACLFFLGDHATAGDPLPAVFDALVADVFEPLLDGDSP